MFLLPNLMMESAVSWFGKNTYRLQGHYLEVWVTPEKLTCSAWLIKSLTIICVSMCPRNVYIWPPFEVTVIAWLLQFVPSTDGSLAVSKGLQCGGAHGILSTHRLEQCCWHGKESLLSLWSQTSDITIAVQEGCPPCCVSHTTTLTSERVLFLE